jgi:hypothetical protein
MYEEGAEMQLGVGTRGPCMRTVRQVDTQPLVAGSLHSRAWAWSRTYGGNHSDHRTKSQADVAFLKAR